VVKPSEALAKNIRAARGLRGMKQEDLATLMKQLGHSAWTRTTVSEVEAVGEVQRRRRVTVDELFGLALALGRSIPELLENSDREALDCGLGEDQKLMDPVTTNLWTRGRRRLWAHGHHDGYWLLDVQEVEP
jgi:transcriptional regulator with XRE-family HTH domain